MAKRPLLTLSEWGTVEASLPAADAAMLRDGPGEVAVDAIGPERYRLTASHYVGSLALPERDVVIKPKVGVRRLFFMLGYSRRLQFRDQPVRLGESPDLTETVVRAFLRQTRSALRRGPLHGYQTLEDAATTVRGRVRFADQARRRFGLALPVEVTYDDFTVDIAENRLLKAALRRIERLRLRDPALKPIARELVSALDAVTEVRFRGRAFVDIPITRLNRHYEQAIGLARLVLTSVTADLVSGRAPVPSFVVDMDKVFEDFIYQSIGDALHLRRGRWKQGRRTTLDVAGRVGIKPDLSIWVGPRCTFVGDVKYKVTNFGENDDLYHVLSYVRATGLTEGLLVYASASRAAERHVVRNDGSTLHVRYIDLEGTEGELLASVGALAALIQKMSVRAGGQSVRQVAA